MLTNSHDFEQCFIDVNILYFICSFCIVFYFLYSSSFILLLLLLTVLNSSSSANLLEVKVHGLQEVKGQGQGLQEVKQLVQQKQAVERELGELKAQLTRSGFSSLSQMR